ncbi:hypothetical protein [Neorhizobium galegae]|uniref:hypothetical protein n=1 Tax=Neorhizobium galegae TaxID=399 RepID=UPI002035A51B|nr:hypothetical protein [Neorhizobium galegae]MCM2501569.1 hypothetical protein [Neorhizobium galegae]MCQ1775496.1 hypothetical protein [Neorhizobium galegae]MCQ1800040.1 hypothetical protein [Neorhizobium galegae]
MSGIIENFLDREGPCLTSAVSDHLVKIYGVAPAAARKRVSRVAGNVKRLAYITFPRKARFIYLSKDFGSPRYWRALEAALLATNSVYGLAISAIRHRGGVIPAGHFQIACGSPLKQARHLSPATVLQRLTQAKLLQQVQVSGVGDCVTLVQAEGYYDFHESNIRARLITEALLLTAVRDWVKKLGLGSYDSVQTRDDNLVGGSYPTVGTFAWDLTAPSYLGPMLRYDKDGNAKNGFIACDVLLGKGMTAGSMRPFIHKCTTLRRLRNVGPCLQIFVADRYDQDAFALAKKHGIMPATPESLFGREVAEGLQQLTQVLHEAATSIDPVKFDFLFRRLGKIEGAAIQLRGTLFEYIVADVARKSFSPTVRLNRKLKNPDGKEAEVDVMAVKDNQAVLMIECKGYGPYTTIPDKYMQRWLQHNVPVSFKWLKNNPEYQNLKLRFEFWATGTLSPEAIAMFDAAKATIRPERYTIDLKFAPQILAECKATNDDGLTEAFKKHYMKSVPETHSSLP